MPREFLSRKGGIGAKPAGTLTLRCPKCSHLGSFKPLKNAASDTSLNESGIRLGIRVCPNQTCETLIFAVINGDGSLRASFPPELIDFDSTDLPKGVLDSLSEAIICHANECYVAAAIMVRKTLEELCADKQVTEGNNLKKRLASLGGAIALPGELVDGLDDLRLLGNDAAHVEFKSFENIGPDEAALAIAITKEVLKAVYQHDALIKQLQSYRRPIEGRRG